MAAVEMSNSVTMNNKDVLEDKKQIINEKLRKRDEERIAVVEKNREVKAEVVSAKESVTFFEENFMTGKNDLENELAKCESLDKKDLVVHFDEMSALHVKLQKYLTESTMFLPSHSVRKAGDVLSKLQSQIQEKRDLMLPKKKFAFKSKKKGTLPEKLTDKAVDTSAFDAISLAECRFLDKENETLEMDTVVNQKDVALANLKSCTVKLTGSPSAIHVNNLNNCTILSGPVSGSIFIRECTNCTFVVACQQLRIHSTTDTKFYIHVTSRAIIEDCSTVSFGPYNWTYPSIEEHYSLSGLDKSRNSWNDIDDFNWLAANQHSPNWSLIPENERKEHWD